MKEEKINPVDLSAHTLFMADLFSYALQKHGYSYRTEHFFGNRSEWKRRRFLPAMGEAVLKCRRSLHLQEEVQDISRDMDFIEDVFERNDYFWRRVWFFAEETFVGGKFMREFTEFCAFMVEVAIDCAENGNMRRINVFFVRHRHLYTHFWRSRFKAMGWHTYHQYAIRYLMYV